jgi:hypothetical protein
LDRENDGHFERFDLYLPGVENAKEVFTRERDGMIVPVSLVSTNKDKSGITGKTDQKDLDNDGKIDRRLATFFHDGKKILEVEMGVRTGEIDRTYFVQGNEVMREGDRYRDGRREPFFVIYHPSKDPTEGETFVRQPNGSVKPESTAERQARKKMVAELLKTTQEAFEVTQLQSQSKNATELVNGLRKSAEGGNILAMTRLGQCYHLGHGIAVDPTQAVYWYQKAADAGDTEAMLGLATCYNEGKGVERDPLKVLMWTRKAAQSGDARAKALLDKHPNLK